MAEITFNLWYRLSEELYMKNSDALTGVFKPYVERLIAALCHHCQMEPDHVSVESRIFVGEAYYSTAVVLCL